MHAALPGSPARTRHAGQQTLSRVPATACTATDLLRNEPLQRAALQRNDLATIEEHGLPGTAEGATCKKHHNTRNNGSRHRRGRSQDGRRKVARKGGNDGGGGGGLGDDGVGAGSGEGRQVDGA